MDNKVNIFNDKNYDLADFPRLAQAILKITIEKVNIKNTVNEIAVIFIDEEKSLKLNKTYRKKDYIADVLSFPSFDQDLIINNQYFKDLGDVYICYLKAKNQALDYEHSLTRELSFLFLHGLLHNLGYDHENIHDEKIMFGLQKEILSELKIMR